MAKQVIKKVITATKTMIKDEKGGPGLEEATLLVFVGLIVSNAAEELGNVIDGAFSSSTSSLRDALGL